MPMPQPRLPWHHACPVAAACDHRAVAASSIRTSLGSSSRSRKLSESSFALRQIARVLRQRGYPKQPQNSDPTLAVACACPPGGLNLGTERPLTVGVLPSSAPFSTRTGARGGKGLQRLEFFPRMSLWALDSRPYRRRKRKRPSRR
jgi:hypothetical protein